jgi:hypothetical protein
MKFVKIYKQFLKEAEDGYKMQHQPPDQEDGAPLYDLTKNGIYPDDVYSNNAIRYYGTGFDDAFTYNVIKSAKGKPNALVTIYRAMPNLSADVDNQIADLTTLFQYVNNFGFAPLSHKKITKKSPDFFDKMRDKFSDEFEYDANKYLNYIAAERRKLIDLPKTKTQINRGNWVTLSKKYAQDHARGEKNWKVISKKVKASELYTDGNSWDEWGWWG